MLSEGYRLQQQELHKNARYGAASAKMAPRVRKFIDEHRPRSILDYGAGKRRLRWALKPTVPFVEYDPCVPEIAELPEGKFDLVCCIDVLEHVEPEYLESVLPSIREKTWRFAFVTIHTGPAGKFLPDGRNAHLIQEGMAWWRDRLEPHFDWVDTEMLAGTTILAICGVDE